MLNFCPVAKPEVANNNQCPSGDNSGVNSPAKVFMFGPRFRAAPQSAFGRGRSATHKSKSPKPPGRSVEKKIVSPSAEMAAWNSLAVVLIDGPMFTGVDHAENCCAETW